MGDQRRPRGRRPKATVGATGLSRTAGPVLSFCLRFFCESLPVLFFFFFILKQRIFLLLCPPVAAAAPSSISVLRVAALAFDQQLLYLDAVTRGDGAGAASGFM